jgi:CCR4-NOT transcription complex subunit 6
MFAPLLQHHCKDSIQQSHYSGPQVAVVRHLRHRSTRRSVVVACTHISANFKNPDTQLAQVVVLTQKLQEVQRRILARENVSPAIVLCGDFNSKPDSGTYEFLLTGALDPRHRDTRPLNSAVHPLSLLCSSGGATHALSLESAYCTVNHREPAITNLTGANQGRPGFEDCLDYVWYSRGTNTTGGGGLEASAVAAFPPDAQLRSENGGLPNSWCPSDHLPLGVAFRFR